MDPATLFDSLSAAQQASLVGAMRAMTLAGEAPADEESSAVWWIFLLCAAACVGVAALAAGLTLGVGGIDADDLQRLILTKSLFDRQANDPSFEKTVSWEADRAQADREATWARRLVPIIGTPLVHTGAAISRWDGWWGWRRFVCTRVSRAHLRLVTLLLANSVANEALPIFLSKAFPPQIPAEYHEYLSVGVSVTFVLIFGEIVPSAIFTGHRQLQLASAFSLPIQVVQIVAMPLAFPISWIMDRVLGAGHARTLPSTQEQKAQMRMTLVGHLGEQRSGDSGGRSVRFDVEEGGGAAARGAAHGAAAEARDRAGGTSTHRDSSAFLEGTVDIIDIIVDMQQSTSAHHQHSREHKRAIVKHLVDALVAQGACPPFISFVCFDSFVLIYSFVCSAQATSTRRS